MSAKPKQKADLVWHRILVSLLHVGHVFSLRPAFTGFTFLLRIYCILSWFTVWLLLSRILVLGVLFRHQVIFRTG